MSANTDYLQEISENIDKILSNYTRPNIDSVPNEIMRHAILTGDMSLLERYLSGGFVYCRETSLDPLEASYILLDGQLTSYKTFVEGLKV